MKNDSILPHNVSIHYSFEITYNSHTHKYEHMNDSTINLSLFSNQHLFQLTQDQKSIFKGCNEAKCKYMVILDQCLLSWWNVERTKLSFLFFIILIYAQNPPHYSFFTLTTPFLFTNLFQNFFILFIFYEGVPSFSNPGVEG